MEAKKNCIGSGRILFFLQRRGFGFIVPDDDTLESNIFYGDRVFHYIEGYDRHQQDKRLQEECTRVEFVAELETKGWRATEVKLAQEELDKIAEEEENEDLCLKESEAQSVL